MTNPQQELAGGQSGPLAAAVGVAGRSFSQTLKYVASAKLDPHCGKPKYFAAEKFNRETQQSEGGS